MRVSRLETTLVEIPFADPIGTTIHAMASVGCVLVEAHAEGGGVVGQSYIFTLSADRLRSFDEMVRGFTHLVVGRDPHDTEAISHDIWREINPTGHKGVTISALSAIDVALWDLVGRAANLPLHKMFGACRDAVDTYASSGLWLSASIDELVAEAQRFVDGGFQAMKVRLGSDRMADDVARIHAVRETIGARHRPVRRREPEVHPKGSDPARSEARTV